MQGVPFFKLSFSSFLVLGSETLSAPISECEYTWSKVGEKVRGDVIEHGMTMLWNVWEPDRTKSRRLNSYSLLIWNYFSHWFWTGTSIIWTNKVFIWWIVWHGLMSIWCGRFRWAGVWGRPLTAGTERAERLCEATHMVRTASTSYGPKHTKRIFKNGTLANALFPMVRRALGVRLFSATRCVFLAFFRCA